MNDIMDIALADPLNYVLTVDILGPSIRHHEDDGAYLITWDEAAEFMAASRAAFEAGSLLAEEVTP